MCYVVVGVVLVLDISLDGAICFARRAGSHDGGIHTACPFPVDEISHSADEVVIADNQQVALFVQGSVSALRGLIVDEVASVDILEVRVGGHHIAAAGLQRVLALVVHFIHLHGNVVVHAECLRHGVIDERMHGHILSAVVAEDVWLVQLHALGGEEGILIVAVAVGVGHRGRVNSTGEVSLRGSHRHILEVHVLGIHHADIHAGLITDDGGDAHHRHVRLAGMGRADSMGNGDYLGLTLRGGYRGGVETRHLKAHRDAFLG